MRSAPNSVYRILTALCRSICFSTQTIHGICRESRYARYSFVTFVDIMTINGESPLLSSCHNQFFRPQTSSCGRLYMFHVYPSRLPVFLSLVQSCCCFRSSTILTNHSTIFGSVCEKKLLCFLSIVAITAISSSLKEKSNT